MRIFFFVTSYIFSIILMNMIMGPMSHQLSDLFMRLMWIWVLGFFWYNLCEHKS